MKMTITECLYINVLYYTVNKSVVSNPPCVLLVLKIILLYFSIMSQSTRSARSTPIFDGADSNSLFGELEKFLNQGSPAHSETNSVVIPIKKKKPHLPGPSRGIASTSAQANDMDWPAFIQEYDALMMNKGKIDSRRFNFEALVLLNKSVATIRSMKGVFAKPSPGLPYSQGDTEEAFGEFRRLLLTAKDMASEVLVEKVVAFVNQGLSPLMTADERKEELQKKTISFISGLSPQMSIKTTPIVKSYIAQMFGSDLDDLLGEVRLPEMSLKEKTHIYTRMFENFFDHSRCISFAATNKQLLGDLDPADVWFLTFFAFVTVKRSRGDNLLMLGCVGECNGHNLWRFKQ